MKEVLKWRLTTNNRTKVARSNWSLQLWSPDCLCSNFQEVIGAQISTQTTLTVPANCLDQPTERLNYVAQSKLISGLCGRFVTRLGSSWKFSTWVSLLPVGRAAQPTALIGKVLLRKKSEEQVISTVRQSIQDIYIRDGPAARLLSPAWAYQEKFECLALIPRAPMDTT